MTKPTRVIQCALLSTLGLLVPLMAAADDGDLAWARQFAGDNSTDGKSIALDSARNVISAGVFLGTTDFDPDAGTRISPRTLLCMVIFQSSTRRARLFG